MQDGRLRVSDQLIEVNGYSLKGLRNAEAVDLLRRAIRDPLIRSLSTMARYSESRPPDAGDPGPFVMLCIITARRYGVYQSPAAAPNGTPLLTIPSAQSALQTSVTASVEMNNGWSQPRNLQDFVHVDLYDYEFFGHHF